MSEANWLVLGFAAYCTATLVAWVPEPHRRRVSASLLPLMSLGVLACATTIGLRWANTGYGPFLTLYEVLLSNIFSLGLILTIAVWRVPATRAGVGFALPVIVILGIWVFSVTSEPGKLPATFESPWLWLHVGFGKVFLGTLLVSWGMAAASLYQEAAALYQEAAALYQEAAALHQEAASLHQEAASLHQEAASLHQEAAALTGKRSIDRSELDGLVWRFAGFAFVFDSAMLLAGAVWANDAWGSYWNWDPVETWALVTWLVLGICLHAKLTWRMPLWSGWVMIAGVFMLAFLTLFGMPFVSLGPHKGIL